MDDWVGRLTLTKKEAQSPFGVQLCHLLERIGQGTTVTTRDAEDLYRLVESGPREVSAVVYLRRTLRTVLLDGSVDQTESMALRRVIERVAPKSIRDRMNGYEAEARPTRKPATVKQRDFVAVLGGTLPAGASVDEASRLIDVLLKCRPPTPRQLMVLRFWNRMDLAELGREAVSDWMDQIYESDPRTLAAWEHWKSETNDFGQIQDPMTVPLGIGLQYLNRDTSGSGRDPRAFNRTPAFVQPISATGRQDPNLRTFRQALAAIRSTNRQSAEPRRLNNAAKLHFGLSALLLLGALVGFLAIKNSARIGWTPSPNAESLLISAVIAAAIIGSGFFLMAVYKLLFGPE